MTVNVLTKYKWVRVLAWTVVGILLLGLLSWLLVPPILKSQIQKLGSDQLGRAVTVGDIDFKPWSLELTLRDLTVAGPAGASRPQLQVKSVYVNAASTSIVRFAPVIDAITVDGVELDVAHLGQGKYDFDDILDKLAKDKKPEEPGKEPARFALYNLSLANAAVNYSDVPVKRVHELRDLALTVPFLSSFDGQRDVNVEPKLAFVLNGSRFDSAASSTPFAQTRKTDATITFSGFDLEPYLQYIPASVPLKVQGAVFDAELKLGFEQTPKTSVKLSGNIKATKVKVADSRSQDLFSLDELKVELVDVRPLEKIAKLGAIEIAAPSLAVSRDVAGRLNLAMGVGGAEAGSAVAVASKANAVAAAATTASSSASASASSAAVAASGAAPVAAAPPASAASAATTSTATAWHVEVAKVALRDGSVSWTDAATGAQTASLALNDLSVDVNGIVVPFDKPMNFKAAASLGRGVVAATPVAKAASSGGAASAPGTGRFKLDGTATDKAAKVKAGIDDVSLELAAPYIAAFLEPSLVGKLNADVDVDWQAAGQMRITAKELTVDQMGLVSSLPEDQRSARRPQSGPSAKAGSRGAATTRVTPRTGSAAVTSATRNRGAAMPAAAPASGPVARAAASASPSRVSDAPGTNTVVSVERLRVADAAIDLSAQRATIGSVTVTGPRTGVSRGADKRWMYERWLKSSVATASTATTATDATTATPAASPSSAPASAPATTAATKPAWTVVLDEFALDGGAVSFVDNAGYKPVTFVTNDVKVRMGKVAPGASTPSPLEVSARIGSGRTELGTIDFKGTLTPDPLAATGQIDLARIPVHALQPYFGDALNVELERADTSFKGNLRFASARNGPTLKVTGNAQVDNFRANSNPQSIAASESTGTPAAGEGTNAAGAPLAGSSPARPSGSIASVLTGAQQPDQGEELLSWKSLGLRGVDVSMAPGTPLAVNVSETAITDLYARLILKENARLNLQDLVKSSDPAAPASAASPASPPAGQAARSTAASQPAARASSAANGGASQTASAANAPVIKFGPVSLVNAKVLFSDRFVKPNYSANLSELTGTLSAFSSVAPDGAPQLADLELRGRAEGTASLEITGKLNPLAKPLALDISAKVRDLELPPLSPYSVKYSGYGIQRGKMSVDVHYEVQPNGQLIAQNKLVLNQLSFGDKVEGSTASLPVKLAVALLADRNGVIDLDLPLSGSLNDPQFSLGSIIGKAIVNLLVKAITAPFSLLANAFGGGGGGADEASVIEFRLGSITLGDAQKADLDKVAKALIERPALKMTVVGTASVDAEREPYRRERLNQLLQAEKRKATGAAPAAAAASVAAQAASLSASSPANRTAPTALPPIEITPAEYPELIRAVYRSADIAKPRNMLGLARDIEPAQMEALLLSNISVSDESIRELAVERAVTVRDYLASRQLPLDRLFLGAAKTTQQTPPPASAASAASAASGTTSNTASGTSPPGSSRAWTPSAELNLSAR
ncbi:hypothetical protein BH09PSE5_BH09PSE5_49580 [soil metagenome]